MPWKHIIYYPKVMQYYLIAAKMLLQLKWYLRHQYRRDTHSLFSATNDYHYFSRYYNRTQQYMLANFFFGEWLSALRHTHLSTAEQQRFAWLSSCAPIFDDFFENEADLEHIIALLRQPIPQLAKNHTEHIAVFFFSRLQHDIPHKEELISTALKLFEAQKKSKLQKTNKAVDKDKLLELSIHKGGYSGQMYGLLLDNILQDEAMLHLSYLLGAYGQMMDDIYDLYDDAQEGIANFANTSAEVSHIISTVEQHRNTILQHVEQHFADTPGYHRFLNVMHIFDAMIALPLSQYKKQSKQHYCAPNNCLYSKRKHWIVDMEKPINTIRLFNLSAKMMQTSSLKKII